MERAPGHANPPTPHPAVPPPRAAEHLPRGPGVRPGRPPTAARPARGSDHRSRRRPRPAAGTTAGAGPARRPGAGRAARGAAQQARRQPYRRAHLRRRPDPRWTPKILAILKQHGAVATFCMVSRNVAGQEALVRQLVDAGMRLCDHSHTHDELLPERDPERIADEVVGAGRTLSTAAAGAPVEWFRAPGGNWSTEVAELSAEHGMQPLSWNVDPRDWERPGADAIVAAVQQQIAQQAPDGPIVLLHDGGGPRSRRWRRWRSSSRGWRSRVTGSASRFPDPRYPLESSSPRGASSPPAPPASCSPRSSLRLPGTAPPQNPTSTARRTARRRRSGHRAPRPTGPRSPRASPPAGPETPPSDLHLVDPSAHRRAQASSPGFHKSPGSCIAG